MHTKFLRVILSDNLTWKEHLKVLLSKVNSVLRKLSYTLPSCIITNLYNSLILPCIDYCNNVCDTRPSILLDKLYSSPKQIAYIN